MALTRIGCSADLAALFARSPYAVSPLTHLGRPSSEHQQQLHASVVRSYPEAPTLALPNNVSEIFNIETSRFAPERARDIAAPVHLCVKLSSVGGSSSFASSDVKMHQLDSRVDSYDCFGAVSLNGSMQTNVPKPFRASGRSTYLNMPGGMWAQDGKYIAEIMKKSHFKVDQMRHLKRYGALDGLFPPRNSPGVTRCYSTAAPSASSTAGARDQKKAPGDERQWTDDQPEKPEGLTKRERFKIIVKDYGTIVLIFHVSISLVSLGICYTLVSSGLDVKSMVELMVGPAEEGKEITQSILGEGSTFLIAYGVHKLFAPMRLSITLASTPFIVRALRRRGWFKHPNKFD